MAISKATVLPFLLLLSLFLFHLSAAIDCGGACAFRCSKSSRPNLCKRACGSCCSRCNCVPPGTSGNEELCPCYFNITTRGGQKKCP